MRAVALPFFFALTLVGAGFAHDEPSPWRDYEIIIWQPQTSPELSSLKKIGVTAGTVHIPGNDYPEGAFTDEIGPLLGENLPWYVENIATDFYSPYHRWSAERPVNWKFQAAKALYLSNPNDLSALRREPSLSDSVWLDRIRERLTRTVQTYAPYRPIFYNLADESGIAELSIPWDFDFSEVSLKEMRVWLAAHYGSIAALNAEWNTHFADWDSVIPVTTRQAIARTDDNFAAWADFKDWMDEAFMRALQAGSDAIHRADSTALSGIEGAQIPGWGGYDYTRLARAVDVMEVYDGGGNVEIVRSLNPGLIMLTTSAASGAQERYQIWREFLRGSRGIILWDPNEAFAAKDGSLGTRGRDAAPLFRELRSGIAALVINSERHYDPVAVLYSPESLRTQWMLDWRPRGQAWAERDISASYEDANEARDSMMRYDQALERIGLHPHFISPELLVAGDLERRGDRVLILPHALALSPAQSDAIRKFLDGGRTVVLADTEPGEFDQHSRRLEKLSLVSLFQTEAHATIYPPPSPPTAGETACTDADIALSESLGRFDVRARFNVADSAGKRRCDLETYEFRNGAVRIFALQRPNVIADSSKAEADTVTITLPQTAFAYNVRQRISLGHTDRVEARLDSTEPTILALSPTILPAPRLAGPQVAHVGEAARFVVSFDAPQPAKTSILHVEIGDPDGTVQERLSRNLPSSSRGTSFSILLNPSEKSDRWLIRVTDRLSGQSAQREFQLLAPVR
jgi:hypothetical protein